MSEMNTMTKIKKLPFGTNVEVVISLKVDDFNSNDQTEVWKFFRECSDTFCLCRIPRVVGEMKEAFEEMPTEKMLDERKKKTLEYFGYDKPLGRIGATLHNEKPFENFSDVIKSLQIDEKHKTRIIFDYDPDFEHCLTQIIQSD